MPEINLTDTKELREIIGYEDANEFLKLGWLLIDKYKAPYENSYCEHQDMVYVLAWLKNEEPVHPKTKRNMYEDYDLLENNT